jgi:hypothetical protein
MPEQRFKVAVLRLANAKKLLEVFVQERKIITLLR